MNDDRLDFQPGEPLRGTPYRVLKRVGAGGMGAVFEIEHVRLKKRLIAKTMHPGMRARQEFLTRMEIEAQTLARIGHPNIVQVHDLGVTDDGIPFFVMEKLEGSDLRKLLRTRRYLDIQDAITIVEDVLEALAHAHREGVIHRDIKPENIFLARSGAETVTKILDFGIAKVMDDTRNLTGARFLGTCQYAAPEQLRGERASEKTDIYAVGCLLFELIAGRRPFQGPTTNDFIRQHLADVPPRLATVAAGVPAALDAIVASALDKDPQKRPISALWFASQLHQIQQITEHVELAQANTTEEMLLTAITEGISSSSPELPSNGDTVADTARDAPPIAAETKPDPRAKTVEAVQPAGARTSSEDRLRRAVTRTSREQLGERLGLGDTEDLAMPARDDADAPSPTPSPYVLAVPQRPEPRRPDDPKRAGELTTSMGMRPWRRGLIISSPVILGAVAAIVILAYGARRRDESRVAPAAVGATVAPPEAWALPVPAAAASSAAPPAIVAPAPAPARSAASETPISPGKPSTSVRSARTVAPSVVAPKSSALPSTSAPTHRDEHLLRTF